MSQAALLSHNADRLRAVRDSLRTSDCHEPALQLYQKAMAQLQRALRSLEYAAIEENRYEHRGEPESKPCPVERCKRPAGHVGAHVV